MKITIKNLQKRIPLSVSFKETVKKVVINALSLPGRESAEITICFVTNKKIRELNLKYLGKDTPTDVIAFNLGEKNSHHLIGDIAISTDAAVSNARHFNTTPLDELYLYVIHGVLHILGYDDSTKKARVIMRRKEARLCPSTELKP